MSLGIGNDGLRQNGQQNMHTGLVTLLLLAVTLRYLGRAVTMLALTYLSLRGTRPNQRPGILKALSPALRAVTGFQHRPEDDEGPPLECADVAKTDVLGGRRRSGR